MKMLFLILGLTFNCFVLAHEGHVINAQSGQTTTWSQWMGSFHLMLLHFPIALINMLAISEAFLICFKKPVFEFASQFLIISAAILSPPTAILGYIYSYSASYEGLTETFLLWHMWLGILTAIFTVTVAIIREKIGTNMFYYSCLLLLFLLVNSASFFGGRLALGFIRV